MNSTSSSTAPEFNPPSVDRPMNVVRQEDRPSTSHSSEIRENVREAVRGQTYMAQLEDGGDALPSIEELMPRAVNADPDEDHILENVSIAANEESMLLDDSNAEPSDSKK